MKKKLRKLKIGTFVRIPLEDGTFGYGRVLSDPYVAFYNYRTTEDTTDLDVISSQPILFILAVRQVGLDQWVNIGRRDLEGELTKPVVSFMQDLVDFRKCVIFDSVGMEKEVDPEECIGIERAAVWETQQIEKRLLDTFMKRQNEQEVRLRVHLQ